MNIILLMILIVVFIVFLSKYGAHIWQVKDYCDTYGYANFKKFKLEFNKREWIRDDSYSDAFWGDKNQSSGDSYVFANVIKFDKKGMILYPSSYILFLFFIFKNRNKVKKVKIKRNTVKWN